MKSKNKLWTFEYPNGAKAQLDYVFIRRKWQNSLKECCPYSSFSSVGSDHRIVTADVKLSLRVSKKSPPNPMKSIDWKKVSSDKDLSSQYAVNVFNMFQELSSFSHLGLDNIDSIYNNLIVGNEEVAFSTLPKKIKSHKNPISADEGVSSARENLSEIASHYHSNPSRTNNVKEAACKRALDNAYSDAEVAFINGKMNELSYLHINHQHSVAWKL